MTTSTTPDLVPATLVHAHREWLEQIHGRYHQRRFIHPDPLEFLYRYDRADDRELVALVASSLAYGRVAAILSAVDLVLRPLGPTPARYLRETSPGALRRTFAGFRYRFTDEHALIALLQAARTLASEQGSLEAAFARHLSADHDTVLPALGVFVSELSHAGHHPFDHLLPHPGRGSACKRLNLFLRWLVRRDDVDPGGWGKISPAQLIVPLDTHMLRAARTMGWTRRKQADLRAACEVTDFFRRLSPDDPLRYDFAITRPGIWGQGMPADAPPPLN